MEEVKSMSKWVSVDKKMPRKGRLVLVYEEDGRIIPALLSYPEWGGELQFYAQLTSCGTRDTYPTTAVTHWRPMPRRPRV